MQKSKGVKNEESDASSEVKHKHGDSVASLQSAHVSKSIIYSTMHIQKTPIYKLSRSKPPKHANSRLTNTREKPVDLFRIPHGHRLYSHNNFAHLRSFAKVPIIPWTIQTHTYIFILVLSLWYNSSSPWYGFIFHFSSFNFHNLSRVVIHVNVAARKDNSSFLG